MNSHLDGNSLDSDERAEHRPGPIGDASDPGLCAGVPALAERIARIWAGELGLSAVGPDDDLLTLGGNSLSAVRLSLAVERALGRPLPERALTAITTARDMARLIEAAGALPEHPAEADEGPLTATERRALATVMAMGRIPVARPGSAIKVANAGGSRPPLFWCFNSPEKEMGGLVPYLDPDQPLYGLCSGGRLYPKTEAIMSRVAEYYAGEIVSLFPDGPYVIGGNCRGAKVAVRIARILMESGRSVDKLCFLEYSGDGIEILHGFDGRLLLMYGKQSHRRAYRGIRWGAPGWRAQFRRPPVVEWVSGVHGRFFRPYNVTSLASTLDRFLKELPQKSSYVAKIEQRIIMVLHKVPVVYYLYRQAFLLRDRLIYGKDVKINPFTGEPME